MAGPMRCSVHDKVYTGEKCPLCAKGQGPATNHPVKAGQPKTEPKALTGQRTLVTSKQAPGRKVIARG